MSSGTEALGGWSRLLRDPVVVATLVVHLVLVLLMTIPVLGPNATSLVVESYVLVPISILGMIAPWVGLPPMSTRKERLFWGLWSLSLGVHLVIRIIYLLVPGVDSILAGSLAIDILYLFFYLPLILSVLIRPDRPMSEMEGTRGWALEGAGSAVFSVGLITYFVVIPRFLNPVEYQGWVPSLLLYWVFDAFLLLSLFYLRQTAVTREWRILYSWLALAPSCWVITEMLELTFYMNWPGGGEWPSGLTDVLWYIPWLSIILAGRMRVQPFPSFLGAGSLDPDESELSRSLGRPGWILVAALVLPLVHFGSNLLGLLDPSTRYEREAVVLSSLVLLLGLASLHQKFVEGRALALERRGRELDERQRRLAAAVEQSPDAILIADGEGLIRYGNRRFLELEGGVDPLLGHSLLEALPPNLEGSEAGDFAAGLEKRLSSGSPWEGKTGLGAEGESVEELVTLSPVLSPAGKVENWILIRRDVTYLNRLERQFRHAQRMETVGTLVGGVARDFNDLLKEIYGHGQFLKKELAPGTSPHREVESLMAAAERGTDLVGRVLDFSKAGEDGGGPVSMDAVAREAVSVLHPSLPLNVRVREELGEGGCEVIGIRHRLRQMVVNLGSNAVQALYPDGGTVTIEVARIWINEGEAEGLNLPGPGPFVRLAVRDTGRGIPESVMGRVFDPFFSTKELEEGTGLGLFFVKETVETYGGVVRLESKEGWGTLVEVFLPTAEPADPFLEDETLSEA